MLIRKPIHDTETHTAALALLDAACVEHVASLVIDGESAFTGTACQGYHVACFACRRRMRLRRPVLRGWCCNSCAGQALQ